MKSLRRNLQLDNLPARGQSLRVTRSSKFLGAFVLALLVGVAARGAQSEYLVDVWTSESGLPNSSVTAIAQTPDGYLWVGTYNGLARFDGARFVTFDPRDVPALANPRVRRLFVDAGGTLWVNTFDGSLTSYRDGKFNLEWKGDGSADAWITAVVLQTNRSVFLLHTGWFIERTREKSGAWSQWKLLQPPGASSGEYCVADGAGKLWLRGRDQKFWVFADGNFAPLTNSGLRGQNLTALVADTAGRIWAGTEQGLAVWDGQTFVNMTPTNGEPGLSVNYLAPTLDGGLWVFANDKVRKARGRHWVDEAAAFQGVFAGRTDRLGVHEDRAGGTWISHYGRGLFHIRADGVTRQLAGAENFPGERVDCLHEDHEGNIWAGVDRGGLVRVREKKFNVLSPGLGKATVTVAEDNGGDIWVGTYGDGLFQWRNDGTNDTAAGMGGKGVVFSVCPDNRGRVWLSQGDEDLWVREDGKFHAVTPAVHAVKSLLAARDGRLWVGTKSGLISLADGRMKWYQAADGISRGSSFRALAEDADGRIWAGAEDGTLYCIANTTNVTWYHASDALGSQPIWSLLAAADGSVWAGTFRGGLVQWRAGKFKRLTTAEGLPDEVICQIMQDEAGDLWVGSHKGIFRLVAAELEKFLAGQSPSVNSTVYGRFDGLPSVECSGSYQPACWRASDGRLFFATRKGVVAVQPESLAPNRLPPPVVIEDVLVEGEFRPLTQRGHTPTLVVPPGKHQVELRYTGLSFVSPDRVRFRYQLVGADKDWVDATRRFVQYNFLRPGHYTFRVLACNNEGVWSAQPATLALEVQPFFYETRSFAVLVCVAVLLAVIFIVRQIAVRRLERKLEFVERQRAVERDRARIARDIHDDLGAGLTHISLLSEVARHTPSAEMNGHLGQISDTARELTRAMDEIVWAVDPQNDTLDSLMSYLAKFAQEYLTVSKVRCRLDLPDELPPWPLRAEVRHNLFLAFKESLNNIVKHAGATEVWLRLVVSGEQFSLAVADNGCGLTGSKKTQTGRISSGRGLANLNNRLAAHGGRCEIASTPGQGTTVTFIITRHHPAPTPAR
ncbi:MAG: hypothetical protein RL380_1404 [Verrucomicrobiota bacterium]